MAAPKADSTSTEQPEVSAVLQATRQRLDALAAAHRTGYPWPQAQQRPVAAAPGPAAHAQQPLAQQHWAFTGGDKLTVVEEIGVSAPHSAAGSPDNAEHAAGGLRTQDYANAANVAPMAGAVEAGSRAAVSNGQQPPDSAQPQASAPVQVERCGSPFAVSAGECGVLTEPHPPSAPSQSTEGIAAQSTCVQDAPGGAAPAPVLGGEDARAAGSAAASAAAQPPAQAPAPQASATSQDAACAALLDGVTQVVGECIGQLRRCDIGQLHGFAQREEEVRDQHLSELRIVCCSTSARVWSPSIIHSAYHCRAPQTLTCNIAHGRTPMVLMRAHSTQLRMLAPYWPSF